MASELAPLVALVATILLIVLLRPLAVHSGLVDIPNERKNHRAPTPLVGGLAIYGGMAVGFLFSGGWAGPLGNGEVYSFFAAGLLLVLVGVADDFLDLSPAVKFVAQLIAALLMIFGAGVVLTDVGSMTLSGDLLQLGWLSVPFTVFATMGVINALNMCDGLDGLSGSLSLTSLSGLILVAYTWGSPGDAALLMILGGAVVAFLLFNRRILGRERASVFMGDAGSMFLGFALTWYAISLSQGEARALRPSAALWFLMVPIFDAVSMMIRRIRKGRSPFAADREHLHHIFLLAGFTVNETVGMIVGLASLGVFVGLASIHFQIPELVVAGVFLLAGLGYFWMISRAWKVMRFLSHSISRRRGPPERRKGPDASYTGPERRSGQDRREQRLPLMSGEQQTRPRAESSPTGSTTTPDRQPQSTRP
jgi:UDP-GlcNAc:undecaprenyl-phosphate GlcNAc-1-phosphate transferase